MLIFLIPTVLVKAQECSLRINGIKATLSLETSNAGLDSIIKMNLVVENHSSAKIYLPKIGTNSFEYHFFYDDGIVYSYFGIKQNFWGPMDLGFLVRVKELLPGETIHFSVDISKKKKENIQEIIYMFDYYPDNKSTRKHIEVFKNEKVIKGIKYWDNCQHVYSLFKITTPLHNYSHSK